MEVYQEGGDIVENNVTKNTVGTNVSKNTVAGHIVVDTLDENSFNEDVGKSPRLCPIVPTCNLCAKPRNSSKSLCVHQTNLGDPCIPQLDGVYDTPYPLDISLPPLPSLAVPSHGTPTLQQRVRQSSYNLQQKKQLTGLSEDSNISDFDITISPVAHNVTIKCNTGFYNIVVIPALSNITKQFEHHVDGVVIHCSEVTKHVDKSNSNVNLKIVFPLIYQGGGTAGAVTVHLHHTTRRVQCQGSFLVHGTTRAPVWFVDNFFRETFNSSANSKSHDISKFNKTVRDVISKAQSKPVNNPSCKPVTCSLMDVPHQFPAIHVITLITGNVCNQDTIYASQGQSITSIMGQLYLPYHQFPPLQHHLSLPYVLMRLLQITLLLAQLLLSMQLILLKSMLHLLQSLAY